MGTFDSDKRLVHVVSINETFVASLEEFYDESQKVVDGREVISPEQIADRVQNVPKIS